MPHSDHGVHSWTPYLDAHQRLHADEIKESANPAEFPHPQLPALASLISPSTNEPSPKRQFLT